MLFFTCVLLATCHHSGPQDTALHFPYALLLLLYPTAPACVYIPIYLQPFWHPDHQKRRANHDYGG